MKIKHENIRMAMNAWAYPDGEKVPAAEIARTYFELGMTFPETVRRQPSGSPGS
ncbi:phage regulatory CII [Escherichia coli]|nr:phage regulatory CII [Escherichia coli]